MPCIWNGSQFINCSIFKIMKIAKPDSHNVSNAFMNRIRHKSRQQIISQVRTSFSLTPLTFPDVLEAWGLRFKYEKYSIADLIVEKQQQLLSPPSNCDSTTLAIDNKELSKHIKVWRHINDELVHYQEIENPSPLCFRLYTFLMQMVRKNSYSEIMSNREYGAIVIEVLHNSINYIPPNFHDEIVKWVEGSEGLCIMQKCLQNRFIPVQDFNNVYRLLDDRLLNGNPSQVSMCCAILIEILRFADYNDVYTVYESFSTMMSSLMLHALRAADDKRNQQVKLAIFYMLDTYDCVISDYLEMGLAYLVCKFVNAPSEEVQLQGLLILRRISKIKERSTLCFFLHNAEIIESGFWDKFCGSFAQEDKSLLFHANLEIRRISQEVLQNFTNNANDQQISELSEKFENQDILEYFKEILEIEEDSKVLNSCLTVLLNCIQLGFQDTPNQQEEEENIFLEACESLSIPTYVQELRYHENAGVASKCQKIYLMLEK